MYAGAHMICNAVQLFCVALISTSVTQFVCSVLWQNKFIIYLVRFWHILFNA